MLFGLGDVVLSCWVAGILCQRVFVFGVCFY